MTKTKKFYITLPEKNAEQLEKEFGHPVKAIYTILNLWAMANWVKGWVNFTGRGSLPRKVSIPMTHEQIERAFELHETITNIKEIHRIMQSEGYEGSYHELYRRLVLKVRKEELEHENVS